MDRERPGRGRRRAFRWLLGLASLMVIALLWQPIESGLILGLAHGSELALVALGAGPAPAEAEEVGPTGPTGTARPVIRRTESWSPAFDAAGQLLVPPEVREWVFVGAAVGLSYSDSGPSDSEHRFPGDFTHVYLDPDSLAHFRETGTFREGATLVLDIHRSRTGVSIARDGWFEGERVGTHATVKDSARFEGGWGYFNVVGDRGRLVRSDSCSSCHLEHGAIDSVFVQFYPLLRDVAPASPGSSTR